MYENNVWWYSISFLGKHDHRGRWRAEIEYGPYASSEVAHAHAQDHIRIMLQWYSREEMQVNVYCRVKK